MAATQHKLRGGSNAGIDINCPGAAELRAQVPKETGTNGPANRGNALHDALEHILKEGLEPEDVNGLMWRGLVMSSDLINTVLKPCLKYFDEVVGDAEYHVEVFMEDPDLPDCGGTADIVFVDGCTMGILDWKTGRIMVDVDDNDALHFYAWQAMNHFELWDTVDNVELHIAQPPGNFKMAEITVEALRAWRKQYVASYQSTGLHPGAHCKWCRGASICEARVSLAKTALEWRAHKNILSEGMDMVEGMEAWCKTMRKDVEAALMVGTDVEGYKVVATRATPDWALDSAAVIRHLKKAGLTLDEAAPRKVITPAVARKTVSLEEEWVKSESKGTKVVRDTAAGDPLQPSGPRDLSELSNLINKQ